MLVDQNKCTILLVEDNPNDIELTIRALHKHNLAEGLHMVRDGEEALEFLFGKGKYANRDINKKPKVILLDLKLPKVTGLEVLKKIKEDEFTSMIPVVVLTTSREDNDITTCYKLGVNSYIVKPVDYKKFDDAVAGIGFYWLLTNELPD